MFRSWKLLTVLMVTGFLAAGSARAVTVHQGVDVSGLTTPNSDAAFASWQSQVSSFTVDDMSGISCGGGPTVCTTTAGSTFTQGVGALQATNFNGGVVSGANLLLVEVTNPGSFTWTLATPADAFGFFAFDNDGGMLTVDFVDGTAQQYNLATAIGSSDSLFWGITGLGTNIASVTITTEDVPGYST